MSAGFFLLHAFEVFEPLMGGIHRRVHSVDRQVQEKWLLCMVFNERARFTAERVGQVFLFLNWFILPPERRLRIGKISVRATEKAERIFEAAILRNKLQFAAQMPLADPASLISGGLEPVGNCGL